ncbi:MAG: hypothetical protein KY469_18935 [Actinobacteria bacterium]|nr:hypothetical protein [Actinomycetota bacterium]
MEALTIALGTAVLAAVLVDLVSTTVAVSGGSGPLTGRLAQAIWAVALRLHRRVPNRRILQVAGPVILFSILTMWLVLLVVGWTLVFSPDAITHVAREGPGTLGDRLYVGGATVIGLGSSGVEVTGWWRLVELLAAASGLALISLSIAYVLPIVSAVVNARETAGYISTLGHTSHSIIERAWDGSGFGQLDLHLIALAPRIVGQAERHLAYPLLFYFRSLERHTGLTASIVALDDALTLLAGRADGAMDRTAVLPVRRAVTEYLATMEKAYIDPTDEPLPWPDLDGLRERGVPTPTAADLDRAAEQLGLRRRLLAALLHHGGWDVEQLGTGRERHRTLQLTDPIEAEEVT